MGWDTQINIIVENITNEESEIAIKIFDGDAISYFGNGSSFIKWRETENGKKILFFTYERRKYLPYWTIQEVSKQFSEKYFTVIASSPDYVGGPAGVVKVENGEIVDSYGFFERLENISDIMKVLENPDAELMYQLFGKNKIEENIRESYLEKNPKCWIEEKYYENMINFDENEKKKFAEVIENKKGISWESIELK